MKKAYLIPLSLFLFSQGIANEETSHNITSVEEITEMQDSAQVSVEEAFGTCQPLAMAEHFIERDAVDEVAYFENDAHQETAATEEKIWEERQPAPRKRAPAVAESYYEEQQATSRKRAPARKPAVAESYDEEQQPAARQQAPVVQKKAQAQTPKNKPSARRPASKKNQNTVRKEAPKKKPAIAQEDNSKYDRHLEANPKAPKNQSKKVAAAKKNAKNRKAAQTSQPRKTTAKKGGDLQRQKKGSQLRKSPASKKENVSQNEAAREDRHLSE